MAYQTETYRAGNPVMARLRHAVETLRTRMERRRVYTTTLRELQALGTRELDDLGLNASTLRRVAWQAAYGK